MSQPSTVVIGSTGLVGSHILATLLSQNLPVTTISRRQPKAAGPTLTPIIESNTDLWTSSLSSLSPPPKTVISALGTTRTAAGGIANQWKIDHDLNVALARAAKESGVKTFVFVSSGGTRGLFSNYVSYSKMKIGVEDTIKELGFDNAVILRPGLILGEREQSRLGEGQAQTAARAIGRWFGLGVVDKFAQEGEVIARAAVKAVEMIGKGEAKERYWILEQSDIVKLGREGWKNGEGK
ncbi:putative mitochondrial protein fmp-52 precursor [Triangularia setosa]|uniref:Mitochondrial protein fmp-52 n=1 Tax=Triangularia setosa TaxID=2587417 RepID=A0AAN7A6W6_9PEZI|nr:putative mitochondrial protein fmp-52 precursor [Podospora setosa]